MQLYHTQPAVRYEWEEGSDESFPVSPGSTSNVVIVVACYGMGEPTDSAKEWYDWLMSAEREAEVEAGTLDFSGMRFSVFGLGSSKTHGQYCTCADVWPAAVLAHWSGIALPTGAWLWLCVAVWHGQTMSLDGKLTNG